MAKLSALWKLGIGGLSAVFVGGCGTVGEPEVARWNIPQPGSAWTVVQRNTGSYGKDTQFEQKRGEATWQGQSAVSLVNSATGTTIMMRPEDGKWIAIIGRDGKPIMTFDPPIGFQYPLKVGKEWATTHRVTTVATGRTTEFVYACKVASYEPVTVPAGTFNSFKINCKAPGSEDTIWYGPDFGFWLKANMRRLSDHPQGPGTQEHEIVALKLVK